MCFKRTAITGMLLGGLGLASGVTQADSMNLAPQDELVKTIIDKAMIAGTVAVQEGSDYLDVDINDHVKFNYTGDIHSVITDKETGVLEKLGRKIGSIRGQAAFPTSFVQLSAGMKMFMQSFDPSTGTFSMAMPPIPAVIPWTCNSCVMTVGDSTYVSIVDALDPDNGSPEMIGMFDQMVLDQADGARNSMRLDGRAFTGVTPAGMDPINMTVAIRMAGCSAVVGVDGSDKGKMGTLCMNATATFDFSDVDTADYTRTSNFTSRISATGTSNCVTVMHTPLMPQSAPTEPDTAASIGTDINIDL